LWRCVQKERRLQLPGSVATSIEAEGVFPTGTYTESTHIHHMCTCPAILITQTNTDSTHVNTDSTNSPNLIPTLADEDRGPATGIHIYTYTVWISPAHFHTQSCPRLPWSPVASCPVVLPLETCPSS